MIVENRFRNIFAVAVAVALTSSTLFGQFFGGNNFKRRSGDSQIPTIITSDSMSVDIANNIAIFKGNVVVDDEQMTIHCHQMTIYLEDSEKKDSGKSGSSITPEGNKSISKIVCIGDVVITRKVLDGEAEDYNGTQRALAGKAVYDMKQEKITLTESPLVLRGRDRITGTSLSFYMNSDMMEGDNVKIEMVQSKKKDKKDTTLSK